MKSVIKITLVVYAVVGALLALALTVDIAMFKPVRDALVGDNDFAFAFDYPWALVAGLVVVPLLVLALTRRRRKAVGAMAFTRGDLLAGAPSTWRVRLAGVPPVLRAGAALLLVAAVARPQIPAEELIEAEGIDIYVILDMSGSMQAIDLTPNEVRQYQVQGMEPPNRFDIAKAVLRDFVQRRRENPWFDRIGMVVFARNAFLQFPLTIDYDTILWLLSRLELNVIDPSQTAIGNALGRAVLGLLDELGPDAERLGDRGRRESATAQAGDDPDGEGDEEDEQQEESKIIVLITDGDERGGNMSAMEAAHIAADEGIEVYTILVGRDGPVLVPADRSSRGFGQTYVQREYPVDEDLLRQVAQVTGGEFFRAENRQALETTLEGIIEQYDKTAHEETIRHRRVDVYFGFVLAGFVLLGLELLLRYGPLRKFP